MPRSRKALLPAKALASEAQKLPAAKKRVLEAVASIGRAVTVYELAEYMEVNANAIRPHLAYLEAVGLVDVSSRRLPVRGRPATLYATRLPSSERVNSGLLALLNSGLELIGPARAYELGYQWGVAEREREFAESGSMTPQGVAASMARLGFPGVWDTETALHIVDCPFAHRSPQQDSALWELHRGTVEGLLGEWPGAVEFHRDDPRGGCVVEFVPAGVRVQTQAS